jgi:signal transduction histidine kinase
MKSWRQFLCFALAFLAPAAGFAAPSANPWRRFQRADGLPDTACVSVTIGPGGNVLARHAKSDDISILDGYQITTVPGPATNRSRVYESPSGQLWLVAPEGLQEFRDGEWTLHRVAAIAAHFGAGRTSEPRLLPIRHGLVLVLLPDQLLQLDAGDAEHPGVEVLRRAEETALGAFTGLSPARDGGLHLSGQRGFATLPGPLRNLRAAPKGVERIPPAELRLEGFGPLTEDERGTVWAFVQSAGGRPNAIASFDGRAWTTSALDVPDVRLGWRDPTSAWFATSDALFELPDRQTNYVAREEFSVRRIYDVAVEPGGAFWLATSEGLYRHAAPLWELVDAAAVEPAPVAQLTVPPDAPTPGAWQTAFTTKGGDVWLGGPHAVAWRHQNTWRVFASTNELGPENVVGFAEALDGRIWCATLRNIWEFDGRDWLILRSSFDRVTALCCARDGTLWVAADTNVLRFTQGAWIVNGPEDGLPAAAVRRLREDARGRMIAETAAGPARLRAGADLDAPRTFITFTGEPEPSFREGAMISLNFGGRDRWKQTPAHRLLFSHRLDEREWSPFQSVDEVSFADLALGKHYFQVRAMDRNGNIDPKPARLEFTIAVPWYRETRLVLILTAALAVAIFFAALAFNRHRRLQHSYAEVERQVTERTRELELANRELLHSQKMNALGTLAAGIAHDFNNILSIIKGSAQLIEDNLDRPDKIRTRLDRIKTVVNQGAGIVEAMLGFSRGSDQPTTVSDVNAVVADTLRLLGDRFLREVEVRFERGADLPEIVVARDFVQQVLLNFIFNAAEAMTERKVIVIQTHKLTALPAGMVLAPGRATEFIAIAVKDSGSGIAPEVLPRIFEPFFTTKALSARRGTGLGLSMVYELARKLDAGLAVETALGQGSTFTLILPLKTVANVTPPVNPANRGERAAK